MTEDNRYTTNPSPLQTWCVWKMSRIQYIMFGKWGQIERKKSYWEWKIKENTFILHYNYIVFNPTVVLLSGWTIKKNKFIFTNGDIDIIIIQQILSSRVELGLLVKWTENWTSSSFVQIPADLFNSWLIYFQCFSFWWCIKTNNYVTHCNHREIESKQNISCFMNEALKFDWLWK